jgi:hypothetical protein
MVRHSHVWLHDASQEAITVAQVVPKKKAPEADSQTGPGARAASEKAAPASRPGAAQARACTVPAESLLQQAPTTQPIPVDPRQRQPPKSTVIGKTTIQGQSQCSLGTSQMLSSVHRAEQWGHAVQSMRGVVSP